MKGVLGWLALGGGIALLSLGLYAVPVEVQGRWLCVALLVVTVAIGVVISRGSP